MAEENTNETRTRLTSEEKADLKQSKTEIRDLKKKRHDLHIQYLKDRNEMVDSQRDELEKLNEDYHYERLKISSPLKANRYALKIKRRHANRILNEAPKRSVLEEVGNAVSHGVGAILGLIFLALMVVKADDALSLTAAIIYGICFFLQMLFSCLYHSFRSGTKVKRIFRRFDYSSIYLAIGGTFAPLYLIYLPEKMWNEFYGMFFFVLQWVLILIGITFVAIFGPGRLRGLHFSLYFAIGWSGLMFVPTWIRQDLPLLFWILMGGLTYTFGMIPFAALKNRKCAHFIWHLVVLLGSILMWVGIYRYVF